MQNLTDITDANLFDILGLDLTAADVVEALEDAGIDARVDWYSPAMKCGSVVAGTGVVIVVEKNRAFVSSKSRMDYGHGRPRLRSHPLYPAPISHPFIAAIQGVLETL